MDSQKSKSIMLDLAIKYKLPMKEIEKIINTPFNFIADTASSIDFTVDQPSTAFKTNFKIMHFGIFYMPTGCIIGKKIIAKKVLERQLEKDKLKTDLITANNG